jgi:hypothetical protein
VGEVIAFEEGVRMQRRRVARALHARCLEILTASVEVARAELVVAPLGERPVRSSRLRKLEELAAYAAAVG